MQVKGFGKSLGIRTKTDGVDSLVLAKYGALPHPKPWLPPAPEARELSRCPLRVQALLSRREAIAQDLQRERGRLEKTEATELPPPVQQPSLDTVTFLGQQLAKLQLTIDQHIDDHTNLKEDRGLLPSIPAVGSQVGNHMLWRYCITIRPVLPGNPRLLCPLGIPRLGAGGAAIRRVHQRPPEAA